MLALIFKISAAIHFYGPQ